MANDDWRTPRWLIDHIDNWNGIQLDPCASNNNAYWFSIYNFNTKFNPKLDGLKLDWKSLTFCNPPYSRGNLIKWTQKAKLEYMLYDVESISLVPIDPSTKWWRQMFVVHPYPTVWCSLSKRVRFIGATGSPKFASALIYYGSCKKSFVRHFSKIGICYSAI
jgi:hypothetical protein